jgi:hypothetical protein
MLRTTTTIVMLFVLALAERQSVAADFALRTPPALRRLIRWANEPPPFGTIDKRRSALRDGPEKSFETARKERASSGGASSGRTEKGFESDTFTVRPEEHLVFVGVSKGVSARKSTLPFKGGGQGEVATLQDVPLAAGETAFMRREKLRLLRLEGLSQVASGEGYPAAIPKLMEMLRGERDPEIASDIIRLLGELRALDDLGDLHRSVTDPWLAVEIDGQLAAVLGDRQAQLREPRIQGALAIAGFVGAYRPLLQPAGVVMLALPAVVLALCSVVRLPLRGKLTRIAVMIAAPFVAVFVGGIAGLFASNMPRADPGSALVILIPFFDAVFIVPVVLCACWIGVRTGSGRIGTACTAAVWAGVYALLQFGTWHFIPLILRGNYFYYGIHPRWPAAQVAYSVAVALTCAVIGWITGAVCARMPVSGPLDHLPPGPYVAVMFPCVVVLGMGYLLVNVYLY